MRRIRPNQALGALVIVVGLWLVLDIGTKDPKYGFPLVLVGGGLLLGKRAFLSVVEVVTNRGEDVNVDATPDEQEADGSSESQSEGEAVPEGQASN